MKYPRRWLAGVGGAVVLVGGAGATIACTCSTPDFGGGGSSAAWPPSFNCYGDGPSCTGLTPATCTTTISATSLQTTLNSATGGEVICVNTGSTGSITLSAKTYSSTVTVQPASGADVTFGQFSLSNVDKLHVTGVGGGGATADINGSSIDGSSGCSSDLTFDHLTYTAGAFWSQDFACSHDLNLLWDHNRHDGDISGGLEEGRIRFLAVGSGPSAPFGLTVSNSHISGGCADGMDFAGNPYGIVIGPGNEFTGIDQGSCGVHVDPIQGLGSRHTTITTNWFHDNAGSGGILSSDEADLVVTNNVFAACPGLPDCYAHSISMGAPINNNYNHNVFVGDIGWGSSNLTSSCGSGTQIVQNNVFMTTNENTIDAIGLGDCPGITYTATYNLNLRFTPSPNTGNLPSGGGSVSPVLVGGGSNPSTYAGWELASSSQGYHAGSDGKSMGIYDNS